MHLMRLYLSFPSMREAAVHPVSFFTPDMIKKGALSSMNSPYLGGENEFLSQSVYNFSRSDKVPKMVR